MTPTPKKTADAKVPVEPRSVVHSAYTYMTSLMDNQRLANIRIEELEKSKDDGSWKVVLSYELETDFPFERKRDFKEFLLDSSGHVLSMKIKKL